MRSQILCQGHAQAESVNDRSTRNHDWGYVEIGIAQGARMQSFGH